MVKPDFERLLLEAVDEGLSSVGESSRQAIYYHLERSFNLKKEEIPCRIEVFADAIEEIFGVGADFLEILIMKNLHSKIGGDFKLPESEDFAFNEYVIAAKERFLLRRNETKNVVAKKAARSTRKSGGVERT